MGDPTAQACQVPQRMATSRPHLNSQRMTSSKVILHINLHMAHRGPHKAVMVNRILLLLVNIVNKVKEATIKVLLVNKANTVNKSIHLHRIVSLPQGKPRIQTHRLQVNTMTQPHILAIQVTIRHHRLLRLLYTASKRRSSNPHSIPIMSHRHMANSIHNKPLATRNNNLKGPLILANPPHPTQAHLRTHLLTARNSMKVAASTPMAVHGQTLGSIPHSKTVVTACHRKPMVRRNRRPIKDMVREIKAIMDAHLHRHQAAMAFKVEMGVARLPLQHGGHE